MKKISILIIILVILISGYFLFFNQPNEEDGASGLDYDNLGVQIRDMSEVPEEYFSGDSKYSHGQCQQDDDCVMVGCSLQVCSSDENLITTCEIGGDSPDRMKYACGCIVSTCGWYRK